MLVLGSSGLKPEKKTLNGSSSDLEQPLASLPMQSNRKRGISWLQKRFTLDTSVRTICPSVFGVIVGVLPAANVWPAIQDRRHRHVG